MEKTEMEVGAKRRRVTLSGGFREIGVAENYFQPANKKRGRELLTAR